MPLASRRRWPACLAPRLINSPAATSPTNKAMLYDVLTGIPGARRDIVLLNAAATLVAAASGRSSQGRSPHGSRSHRLRPGRRASLAKPGISEQNHPIESSTKIQQKSRICSILWYIPDREVTMATTNSTSPRRRLPSKPPSSSKMAAVRRAPPQEFRFEGKMR